MLVNSRLLAGVERSTAGAGHYKAFRELNAHRRGEGKSRATSPSALNDMPSGGNYRLVRLGVHSELCDRKWECASVTYRNAYTEKQHLRTK